jgi:hypothetical protein
MADPWQEPIAGLIAEKVRERLIAYSTKMAAVAASTNGFSVVSCTKRELYEWADGLKAAATELESLLSTRGRAGEEKKEPK